MEIIKAMSLVMEAVGGVSKTERNNHQGFNFRGIDAVVNAVSPALRKHGVVVVPRVVNSSYEVVAVGQKQTMQGHARVTVEYTFFALDGTYISATTVGEAMDSGDKATAKAMSVAFRTALLQALCLPTDERDPDADSYEYSRVVTKQDTDATRASKSVVKTKSKEQDVAVEKAALSDIQKDWVIRQTEQRYEGEDPIVVVGDLIGRTIGSLDDVTKDEVKVLVEKLAGK